MEVWWDEQDQMDDSQAPEDWLSLGLTEEPADGKGGFEAEYAESSDIDWAALGDCKDIDEAIERILASEPALPKEHPRSTPEPSEPPVRCVITRERFIFTSLATLNDAFQEVARFWTANLLTVSERLTCATSRSEDISAAGKLYSAIQMTVKEDERDAETALRTEEDLVRDSVLTLQVSVTISCQRAERVSAEVEIDISMPSASRTETVPLWYRKHRR